MNERSDQIDDLQLYLCAKIAMDAHEGKTDKRGKDEFWHSHAVASMCETLEEQCVALLHDVVENTSVSLEDLRAWGVDEGIVEAVDCITKRKGESLKKYLVRVASNPVSAEVKQHDMEHNSSPERTDEAFAATEKKRKIKYKETPEFMIQLRTRRKYAKQLNALAELMITNTEETKKD
jgi:(p)ppGpp synthase/HD superfamily hydrolase